MDHQNTIYQATVPVALYVAAVLAHPATAAGENGEEAERKPRRSTRAQMWEWLGSSAYDADDASVARGEEFSGGGCLGACPDIRKFRELRPVFYRAVQPFLDHDDAMVRDAAVVAAIPLAEHPALTPHRDELARHARRLLVTNTYRHRRDRALDALKTWRCDPTGLETPEDVAARDRRAAWYVDLVRRSELGQNLHRPTAVLSRPGTGPRFDAPDPDPQRAPASASTALALHTLLLWHHRFTHAWG